MPEILDVRRSIRTEKLHLRESLAPQERADASATITDRVISLVQAERWQVVHSYLAFRSEVSTVGLLEHLLSTKVRVVVPWVEADGELSHHELLSLEGFSEGPYGLPHPARNEFTQLEMIDAVLLPLSAFDREGNRLGYGKGFYDRFLSKLPARTRRIGLAFAIQEAEQIPAMEHDQKLEMIVTEKEIIRIAH